MCLYEQLVVSNEVIKMVRRITRGVDVNEETMALDVIYEVGPGGEFLTSRHTLNHFRENFFPELISRLPYETWVQKDGKDLGTRANEKVRYILENHDPKPLEERIKTELRHIVESRNK